MYTKTSEEAKAAASTGTAKVRSAPAQEQVGSTLLRLLSQRPCTSLVAELDHTLRAYYMEEGEGS